MDQSEFSLSAVCTICTERFDGAQDVSAVKCGHLFHDDCLTAWLIKSQTCPHCRHVVAKDSVIKKLFFAPADDSGVEKLSGELRSQLCLSERELAATKEKANELATSNRLYTVLTFLMNSQRRQSCE